MSKPKPILLDFPDAFETVKSKAQILEIAGPFIKG